MYLVSLSLASSHKHAMLPLRRSGLFVPIGVRPAAADEGLCPSVAADDFRQGYGQIVRGLLCGAELHVPSELVPVHLRASPFFFADPQVVGHAFVFRHITGTERVSQIKHQVFPYRGLVRVMGECIQNGFNLRPLVASPVGIFHGVALPNCHRTVSI